MGKSTLPIAIFNSYSDITRGYAACADQYWVFQQHCQIPIAPVLLCTVYLNGLAHNSWVEAEILKKWRNLRITMGSSSHIIYWFTLTIFNGMKHAIEAFIALDSKGESADSWRHRQRLPAHTILQEYPCVLTSTSELKFTTYQSITVMLPISYGMLWKHVRCYVT